MKKIKLVAVAIFLLVFLSGCFQIERVINVNKDGSGTIEETVLMSQEFINQIKQMATSFDQSGRVPVLDILRRLPDLVNYVKIWLSGCQLYGFLER